MDAELLAILCAFAEPPDRPGALVLLARRLGVTEVLLFVRDAELGVLLPPLGLPQTLAGGPAWRRFLRGCKTAGRYDGEVDLPANSPPRAVEAFIGERGGILLLGGPADAGHLSSLLAARPLLEALFGAEHAARLAEGTAEVARTTGRRAHELALALDAARGDVERALDESARLNLELKEDDRRKDEFLAMLGHELRNPMAAIGAALEVLRGADAAQGARARDVIERQTKQLTRLVDDLLDVARVTRGKIELQRETVDIVSVARSAVESTQAFVVSRALQLEIDAPEPVHTQVDRARLEQMVTNLLTNAAKYTNHGGRIRLAVHREGREVVIRVEDNGIGISASMLETVFDPFVQVAPTIDRGAGGLGIGLTLVRSLAALHGGSVTAASELGVGSAFTVRLPAADTESVALSPLRTRAAGAKKRILVVDDNVDSAEMLVALVHSWGHEAVHAADGPSAVALASEMAPEVVLLDIGLPGMSGFEVAKKLRTVTNTQHARIVAVSGYGHPSDRQQSSDAGIDEHLVKPVDLAALRRTIER